MGLTVYKCGVCGRGYTSVGRIVGCGRGRIRIGRLMAVSFGATL